MKEGETRTYTVPLRKEWLKVPRWRRSKRAAAALRAFLLKHTKAKQVKIGKWANESLWASGVKKPPTRVIVTVKREKDIARAELATLPSRAKRLAAEAKARAEARKKKETERKAKEAEDKKKQKEYKKKKDEEKKELEEAKEKKAKAKVTKAQEIAMHKR